jgi:O-methyltransferase
VLARLLARRRLAIAEDRWATPPDAPAPRGLRGLDVRLARLEREHGLDWPAHAETMSGLRRLANLRYCVETVLTDRVPGDLVEAGVWRGGSAIFMRGVLAAHDEPVRRVWLADSFAGLPAPDAGRYPSDRGVDYTGFGELAVGLDQVRGNFARFRLLDDRVRFLPGWFADTLPGAPIEQIAVLRLDGDLYASTMDALEALYPRLAPGGFCIIDDFGALETCRRAVEDFRTRHGITEPILPAGDWTGAYWRRSGSA